MFGVLAAAVLAVDLITKQVALASFSADDPIVLLGGLLRFTLVYNTGAAFSLGQGLPWIFALISIVVISAILWASVRLRSSGWAVALGLVLGGAVGNLVDRLVREPAPFQGAVIDWIQLPHWPVFNIADCGIVCGGILAVWLAFRGVNLDGTRESSDKKAGAASADGDRG